MLHPRPAPGLSAAPGHCHSGVGRAELLAGAAAPSSALVRAYAHVIAERCDPCCAAFVPALGLRPAAFRALLATHFTYFVPAPEWLAAQAALTGREGALEEFGELLQLLLDHRVPHVEAGRWIAHLVAAACMGDNHLWQDLGLPHRHALSGLMADWFPALAAANSGDMKWKKFFYRQLCERAQVPICKAPSCGICTDYALCFEGAG